ncbi:glycosyltransferase [Dyella sp. A6]|uniref:glycosyltransferase n=1 Tax=Dyella aluminiiresistens TaxID=3069105 RepID=UPI002E79C454|nr:glycosyltransferase [Dyella sp. A6]
MQNDESPVAQNHAEFREHLDRLAMAVEQADWRLAIERAQETATWAWLHSCGVFVSPELEALLRRIGQALGDAQPTPPATSLAGTRRVLTVLSNATEIGGHTRLATRWIDADRKSRHTIVLTRQDGSPIPPRIAQLIEDGLIELVQLDAKSLIERTLQLRNILAAADHVVLHIHPNDILPNLALAGMSQPPHVLLEDHAGHVFWLGATISNLVVSLAESTARISVARRGIAPNQLSWAPIPIDADRLTPAAASSEIRARFGIPQNAVLLLSSGSDYKFDPIDGVSLARLIAPVLHERQDVHLLLVGPAQDEQMDTWSELPLERVHCAGYLTEAELVSCYHACDVYLDASPFPSNTALLEAAAIGRPVIKYAPESWRQCGFSQDLDAIPPPSYLWSDPDAYRQALLELVDQPAHRAQRGAFARDAVTRCHGQANFSIEIEHAYARAARLPLIEPDPERSAHRIELLDQLLAQLAGNLDQRQRQKTLIALRPMSEDEIYREWLDWRRLSPAQVALSDSLCAGCRVDVAIIDHGDAAALERTRDSLAAQSRAAGDIVILPAADDWNAQLNAFAADSPAQVLLTLHAGDTLGVDAIRLLSAHFAARPDMACCYVDEDSLVDGEAAKPIFKPDLNLDLLRSYPYTGRLLAVRLDVLRDLGGLSTTWRELGHYDLLLRIIERHGRQSVGHLPEVLYRPQPAYAAWLSSPEVTAHTAAVVSAHLDRLGVAHEMQPGALPGINRVRYLHPRQPLVSIIVPTRDQLPMLNGLLDSLLAKTAYPNYELLIVDNDSQEPAACAYLDGIERLQSAQLRVLRYPHPFNYSAINNFAATQARGEYLVLLNNDTAVLQEDWIEALLHHAQRPEVGIVGAKLHYPDGNIQHGGVVLGLRGPADHPFIGQPADANGYMHRLQVDQNYTAVTAACLMIRKSVYEQVGGLDETQFKVSYNDVDLCLKVHSAGYLNVWTPYARLMHEGSVSQRKVDVTAAQTKRERFLKEQETMYGKWLPLLARDPAYSPNLSLNGNGFDLDKRRMPAWQPFARPLLPRLFCVPADHHGCGHYRIMQPFLALQRERQAEGAIAEIHLQHIDMERYAPDSIVLQRQLTANQLEVLRRYREFSRAFKVYELDDYLPNVPLKSIAHGTLPKDILKALRKAVALTDRFVVSTAPLAEQFAGFHEDIRVVRNRLPTDWWDNLESTRRTGRKPRVGWGGGSSHRGDLELIADVVRDLADEVEWVFFGMCPDKLKPYVHEFHSGVPIADYPAKLASLNLDLALAPLEDNLFNACKSNLRLLEYGACGFPVIASDIECYRDNLPATLVKNRYRDWITAIREHLSDLDATARAGDRLRDEVQRDWMLRGEHLEAFRQAWLPD